MRSFGPNKWLLIMDMVIETMKMISRLYYQGTDTTDSWIVLSIG